MLKAIDMSDKKAISDSVLNVLETVTAVKYPVICRLKEFMINNGALASAMSGSGPSVFVFSTVRKRHSMYAKA